MSHTNPQLVYALVARKAGNGLICLGEATTVTANGIKEIAKKVCNQIPAIRNDKVSFTDGSNDVEFHALVDSGIIYLCASQDPEKRKTMPFQYLEDICNKVADEYAASLARLLPKDCAESISNTLKSRMDHFNRGGGSSRANQVRAQVDDVKNIMIENVDQLLARGEKLDDLVDKTDDLQQEAGHFGKRAKQLKKAMWWQNCKLILVIALPFIAGGIFLLFWLCGGVSFCNCKECPPPTQAGGAPPNTQAPQSHLQLGAQDPASISAGSYQAHLPR